MVPLSAVDASHAAFSLSLSFFPVSFAVAVTAAVVLAAIVVVVVVEKNADPASLAATAHSLSHPHAAMPPLARARAPPPSTRAGAAASVAICDLTSDGPVGSPDHYHEVITALSTGHAMPSRCVVVAADPLAVRPAIAKPRPMPGRAVARRMAAAATPSGDSRLGRAQQPLKRAHSAPPALVALYMEGARAVASWPPAAASACAPCDGSCDPCVCGPACETSAGGIDCDTLDAADIEGSLRLRLASLEEAFEYQAARRLVAALDRVVARGAAHAVALHRPLWSRSACLACTAVSAPPRPSPVRIAQRHIESSTETTSSSSSSSVSDAIDVATSLSSFDAATLATKQAAATPFATLEGLCVYTAMRAPDGSIAWTARRRRSDATDRGLGTTTPTASTPSSGSLGVCARCAAGKRARGVVPTAPSTGAVVTVDVGEVVGAVAANLWEGVAGTAISIDAGPDRRYRMLWSGVPGEGPETLGLLDAAAVPSTTWLATETRALVVGGAPRRPANGSDALYACARIAYATARLADTTARQRAAHAGTSTDPRRVRPATPLAYAPSMDSPLAALAWMRGAASLFGAAVGADRALCGSMISYRMHVLARDLERTPLTAALDPAQLPDEVRDLARQLQASLGQSGDSAQTHPAAPWPVSPHK